MRNNADLVCFCETTASNIRRGLFFVRKSIFMVPLLLHAWFSGSVLAQDRVAFLCFENRIQKEAISPDEIGFYNKEDRYAYLESAMTDMLHTDLVKENIAMAERIQIENLMQEVRLSESGLIDPDKAINAGELWGATLILYGGIDKREGNEIIFKVNAISMDNGSDEEVCRVSGQEQELFNIERSLRNKISLYVLSKIQPEKANTHGMVAGSVIAVLPFRDNSPGRTGTVNYNLQSSFISHIAKGGQFRLVERTLLESVLKEIWLEQTGIVDEKTAVKMGRLIAADYMVFGSYIAINKKIRMDIRVVDVENGKVAVVDSLITTSGRMKNADRDMFSKIDLSAWRKK